MELRVQDRHELLLTRQWDFWFHKLRTISLWFVLVSTHQKEM